MLLLITDRKELGKSLAQSLVAQGIFLYQAPVETGFFMAEKCEIGGVVLDFLPNEKAAKNLLLHLQSAFPEMPIFGIVAGQTSKIPFSSDAPQEVLAEKILSFCVSSCNWPSDGVLSTYFLTVGKTCADVTYMGYPLPLSPTEFTVLKCLLYRYPKETTVDDLLQLCFPMGAVHVSNISVLIHRINVKALQMDSRTLIQNPHHRGYVLREL